MGVCRFCGGGDAVIDIFSSGMNDRAMSCTRISIRRDDGLPGMACRTCCCRLTESFDFKVQCEALDRYFRTLLPTSSMKIENRDDGDDIQSFDNMSERSPCDSPKEDLTKSSKRSVVKNTKKSLICNNCNKKFTSKARIMKHLTLCPKYNSKKIGVSLRWLKQNSKASNDDKNSKKFMCDICGNTFKNRQIMIQHQKTHSDVKLYSCDICKKKFTRNSHVVSHMRIHDNIKPFICEICGKSFVKSSDLNRHKKVHFDARDFSCPLCERRFKRSTDVTSHLRSHTGDRPYSCKCGKAYTSHSSLKKHKKLNCPSKLVNVVHNIVSDNAKPKTELQT